MYLKILKKDLRRKISMNIILLIFVALASMFIASGLYNMKTVVAGTDRFFEIAELGDYMIVSMNKSDDVENANDRVIENFLKETPYVDSFTKDKIAYVNKQNIDVNGNEADMSNTFIINTYNIKQQKFFDEKNKEINDMENGTIYMPYDFITENDIEKGDVIKIKDSNGFSKKFEVAGSCKDAFLGAPLMGTNRFLVSEDDFLDLTENSDLVQGFIYSTTSGNVKKLKAACDELDANILFSADQSLVKMTYVMNMVIAGVLLLVSLCLIGISIVMLKFIINFTVSEDYKEIGIMKAIGLKNSDIRKIYVVKYMAISMVGSLIGFGFGIPFGRVMLLSATKSIVIDGVASGIVFQFVVAVLVGMAITGFSYLSTNKIKKLAPMDAIRQGANGERFNKKSKLRLGKFGLKTSSFLAINDVMSEFRKYVALFATSLVGIWLVIMPINTINTLGSDNILSVFGFVKSDIFMTDDEMLTNLVYDGDRENIATTCEEIERRLEDRGLDIDSIYYETMYRFKIRKGDSTYRSIALQGYGTTTDMYQYEEGSAPQFTDEVALGYKTAEEIDAQVGDTVYMNIDGPGSEEKAFIVSGLYQSMNNMGEGIRFHQDLNIDPSYVAGSFAFQINLKGKVKETEIKDAMKIIKTEFPKAECYNGREYIDLVIGGISKQLTSIKILILTIVISICILVVFLMQKMFFIREKGQIGMMKAVGFSGKSIKAWQLKRISSVVILGMMIGIFTSGIFTKLTSGPVFKMMGLKRVEIDIRPLEVWLMYPLIVFVVIVVACVISLRKVKKITPTDMDVIE